MSSQKSSQKPSRQVGQQFKMQSTRGEYWGVISQNTTDFIFPSPVNLPNWSNDTSDWIGEGRNVLEIGPGKADLAYAVLSKNIKTENYYIVDISDGILKYAKERLFGTDNVEKKKTKLILIKGDLNNKDALKEIKPGTLDRVILINVFGYLDPDVSLGNIYKLLKPGGLIRFTSGDYDISTKNNDFDPNINAQYVRGRPSHIDAGIEPLGYTQSSDGKEIPFYGYRRFYSIQELNDILERNGFIAEQFKDVIIPKELWYKVRSYSNSQTDKDEIELLEKLGGRPLSDIIARKDNPAKLDTAKLAKKYDQTSDGQFETGKNLVKELEIKSGQSVLDIGSGTGRLAVYVLDIIGESGYFVGIEPSEHRVQIARDKISNSNASLELGTSKDLNRYPDNAFDVVYLNYVFHHISEKSVVLKEIHRILKPEGKLGIADPDKDSPSILRKITREVAEFYGGIYSFADSLIVEDEFKSLLSSNDFDISKIFYRKNNIYHRTTEEYLESIESNEFGTFLSKVPEKFRDKVKSDIINKLGAHETEKGLDDNGNTIYVVAKRSKSK